MKLTLLSTPLTRGMQFDAVEAMGVDIYNPIFSHKTKRVLGYPMTGKQHNNCRTGRKEQQACNTPVKL